jgi:hypothetical protein
VSFFHQPALEFINRRLELAFSLLEHFITLGVTAVDDLLLESQAVENLDFDRLAVAGEIVIGILK